MKSLRTRNLAILCFGTSMSLIAGPSSGPSLTLLPTSSLSGLTGSTSGWGFSISNPANYIEITSASFCLNLANFPTSCLSPVTGTFTDFISGFQDIIVGPGGSASQAFDLNGMTGIGSFSFSTPGTDTGGIFLRYNQTANDPTSDDPGVTVNDLVFSASASVTAAAPAAPEPGSIGLATAALSFLMLCVRRRRVG